MNTKFSHFYESFDIEMRKHYFIFQYHIILYFTDPTLADPIKIEFLTTRLADMAESLVNLNADSMGR